MTRLIELSEEDYARLERAAAQEGITPAEWVARRIPRWASAKPLTCPDGTPARTMADVLAGRVGLFSSGSGLPSSADASESFADYLEQKQREGRL
jgi:hypothetical protein